MNFDDTVEAVGDLQTTVLAGLRVCPVCLGMGKMCVNDTYIVDCWECAAAGRLYTSTTSEVTP